MKIVNHSLLIVNKFSLRGGFFRVNKRRTTGVFPSRRSSVSQVGGGGDGTSSMTSFSKQT